MELENGTEVTWEICDWFYTFSIGEASAGKYPKNVSNMKCSTVSAELRDRFIRSIKVSNCLLHKWFPIDIKFIGLSISG